MKMKHVHARLKSFCNPLIITETTSFCKASLHVCTMNTNIIQHKHLRSAISQGHNHIPLQPTIINP
jgi:hypothetical protein